MNAILILLLAGITPLELITYKNAVCSALHIEHNVTVSYKPDRQFTSNAYAYVQAKNHIVLRQSLVGDKTLVEYLVTHEVCHIYFRHYLPGKYAEKGTVLHDKAEVQTDNCVKRLVGPARWKEMDAAMSRANQRRIVLLSR